MSWTGALGAKGQSSGGFVVVPEECKYCKLDHFKTKERATDFLKENHRIQNIIIITEKEYVGAWNERFANEAMKAPISLGQQVTANSYCQPFDEGAQTNHGESSIAACRQSGELFSKEPDVRRIGGTLLQLDLSKFPDGTRILQVGPPLIIDIPDSYIEAVRNSQLGTDRQFPCDYLEEDLAIYRRNQSSFLIGKSKPDDT